MAQRSYEVKFATVRVDPAAHAEITVLSTDVPGEVLSIETLSIYSSVAGTYFIRKYVGASMVFEWTTPSIGTFVTEEFPGPWNLLGNATDAQSLRVEFVAASNTLTTVSASYSSE